MNTRKRLSEKLDQWIRTDFVMMNTHLEDLYRAQNGDPLNVEGIGNDIKAQLTEQGRSQIADVLQSKDPIDPDFETSFELLGNVGMYMAACRRHEITEPSREHRSPLIEASKLAMQLGATLGMVPRFTSAHTSNYNRAVDGNLKRFTTYEAERIFMDYNLRGVFAYKRASDALYRSLHIGISNPATYDLYTVAIDALEDVMKYNDMLFNQLETDGFFNVVRPYLKPHYVGRKVYRGANAGDFAGINVIDMLLGLCSPKYTYYSELLIDKLPYITPDDQLLLKKSMHKVSIMDSFLATPKLQHSSSWYQNNLSRFIEVCEAHGKAAEQHHHQLVHKFITVPSKEMDDKHLDNLTASGPPLEVLLRSLKRLTDLRLAANRTDIDSRYGDMERLKATLN